MRVNEPAAATSAPPALELLLEVLPAGVGSDIAVVDSASGGARAKTGVLGGGDDCGRKGRARRKVKVGAGIKSDRLGGAEQKEKEAAAQKQDIDANWEKSGPVLPRGGPAEREPPKDAAARDKLRKADGRKRGSMKVRTLETGDSRKAPATKLAPAYELSKTVESCETTPSTQEITKFTPEPDQSPHAEVHRLQRLLRERDASLAATRSEKSCLEQHVQTLETRIRYLEEGAQRLQEENRDLESVVGELRFGSQHWDAETQLQVHVPPQQASRRATSLDGRRAVEEEDEIRKLRAQAHMRDLLHKELDGWKAANEKRFVDLEVESIRREFELTAMARGFTAIKDGRLALGRRVDVLERELRRASRAAQG